MGLFDFISTLFSGGGDVFPGETLGSVSSSGLSGVADALKSSGVDLSGVGEQFGADAAGGAAMGTGAFGDVSRAVGGDGGAELLPWLKDAAGTAGNVVRDIGSGLGGVAKAALPIAQVGAAGLGAYSGVKAAESAAENAKIQKRAIENQERAVLPLTNYGESQLKSAEAGNVPAAIQSQIDLWARGAKQKARDYLARAGIPDSKAAADWESWIDQQAEAMKGAALGAEADRGVAALRSSAQVSGNVGQQAGQQVSTIDGLIANANQVLARLAAGAA